MADAVRLRRAGWVVHPGEGRGVERVEGVQGVRPTLVRSPGAHPVLVSEDPADWLLDDASVAGLPALYLDVSTSPATFKVTPTAPADLSFLGAGASYTAWADVRTDEAPAREGFRQVTPDVHLVVEALAGPEADSPVLDPAVGTVVVSKAGGTQPGYAALAPPTPYLRAKLVLAGGGNFDAAEWKRADLLGGEVVPRAGLVAW